MTVANAATRMARNRGLAMDAIAPRGWKKSWAKQEFPSSNLSATGVDVQINRAKRLPGVSSPGRLQVVDDCTKRLNFDPVL